MNTLYIGCPFYIYYVNINTVKYAFDDHDQILLFENGMQNINIELKLNVFYSEKKFYKNPLKCLDIVIIKCVCKILTWLTD